jgi:replicative DNA helicase
MALLGSIMIEPGELGAADAILCSGGADEFYTIKLGWIFSAMLDLSDREMDIDLLMVANELELRGQLKEVGGDAYLTRLASLCTTPFNARSYARLIHETYLRRQLLVAASKIAKLAFEETTPIDDVVNEAGNTLFAVGATSKGFDSKTISFAKASIQFEKEVVDAIAGENQLIVTPTGLSDVDRILQGGLWQGDFDILGARTGRGKTAFATTLAYNTARFSGRKPFIWSGEMIWQQVLQRMLGASVSSLDAPVADRKIRAGVITPEEFEHLQAALSRMKALSGYINDFGGASINVVCRTVHRLHKQGLIDSMIFDYLQLAEGISGTRYTSVEAKMTDISHALRDTAHSLGMHLLGLTQFNRAAGKNGRPTKLDIKYASSVEQDADGVYIIYDPDDTEPDIEQQKIERQRSLGQEPVIGLEFVVDKRRNGGIGSTPIAFLPDRVTFVSAVRETINLNEEPTAIEVEDS